MSSPPTLFKVDYVNAGSIMAMGIAFAVLCPVFVLARFYTRIRQKARIMADDWLSLAALLLTLGLCTCNITGAAIGALGTPMRMQGQPTPEEILNFSSPTMTASLKLLFAFQRIQVVALGCLKLSFLFFYRRLFCSPGTKRGWFHYTTITLIAIIIAWTLVFFFVFLFSCGTNFFAQWMTVLDNELYCPIQQTKVEMAFSITDVIEDVIILVLPVPQIFTLQISFPKKLAICGVFSLGFIALAASICRFGIFVFLSQNLTVDNPNPEFGFDQLTINTLTLWWSLFESGLGLLAACLPTLSFLFRDSHIISRSIGSLRRFRRLISSRGRSSNAKSHGGIDQSYETMEDEASIHSRTRLPPNVPKNTLTSYNMQDLERGPYAGKRI